MRSTVLSKSQLRLDLQDALQQTLAEHRPTLSDKLKPYISLSLAVTCYGALYLTSLPALQLLLCALTGLFHTLIGFHIFHEAIHGSFSHNRRKNLFWAIFTCSILGVSRVYWRFKHNYLHHSFTNIEGKDDDLDTRKALRLAPSQPHKKRYYFQHIYAPIVYALTSVEWIFIKDFKQYFSGQFNSNHLSPKLSFIEHIEFWFSKTVYITIYVIIPLSFFGPKAYLIGSICFHLTHSIAMASIFQLAHVMESSQYPQTKDPQEHYSHQLKTTINFATRSKFITWFAGGLNYQIEHHLFPTQPHWLYPHLSQKIQGIAALHSLPYINLPTYREALIDHFTILKRLGRQCS